MNQVGGYPAVCRQADVSGVCRVLCCCILTALLTLCPLHHPSAAAALFHPHTWDSAWELPVAIQGCLQQQVSVYVSGGQLGAEVLTGMAPRWASNCYPISACPTDLVEVVAV
jgi:hypothetical protein